MTDPAAIILGALAAIITAAILVKPVFLILIMVVLTFAVFYYITFDSNPFSNFYKQGSSKEVDELADRIQNIINNPDLGATSVLSPTGKSTQENSFGGIYQPAPKETEKLTGQSSAQAKVTPTNKSD